VNVGGVHLGIADDTDLLDGFELLPGEAKETGLEVAGDAVIRHRILQAITEKRIIQPVATGAEALEGHWKLPNAYFVAGGTDGSVSICSSFS